MNQKFIFRTVALLELILGALSLMLAMPAIAKADGPISYWKLDETSGSTYDDFYNVEDGACIPGECPTMTSTAVVTNGQVFNGASNGINVSDNPAFDWGASASFSIEFWMKGIPGQTCAGGNEVVIGRVDGSNPLWSLGCANSSGYANFYLSDTGGISTTLQSTKVITNGVWHHIVGVRDGTNGINRLYVDGQEVISETISYSNSFASTDGLNIGYLNSGSYFEGTIDEVALHDGVLSETDIRTHYYLARGYAESCVAPITIMPLGDSVTKGSQSPNLNGYRKPLYLSLTSADYDVDFVGNYADGDFADPDHQGLSGITATTVAANVSDLLDDNPAEVVLLHIGTNDILFYPPADPNNVVNILDEIDQHDEDITVVLARIINMDPTTSTVTTFNDDVQTMALNRIANGDKIIMVDQESALNYLTDLADGVHPNDTGYGKMAGVWLNALDDFLPICNMAAAPAITSKAITATIVGQPYQYNVVADGSPPLTYSLPISPTGMTINSGTGLIQWTPGATGTFGVEVEAVNSLGVATQSFSIDVAETPVCTTNLISNWKLNETSGPPYQDSYGSHDATTCAGGNCPTPVTGRVGGAQLFESGNDTGLNVPVHPDFDWGQNESFSIEFWMKGVPGQTCAASSEVIVGRTEGVAGGLHWWLGCRASTGQAAFELGSGAQYDVLNSPGDITDRNWHHVVGLREGASDINRLYVDGVEVVSSTTSYTTSFASASADLTLGWIDFSHGFNFEGSLDEVAIYNRALLATEVQQHYNFGPAGQDYCGVEEAVAPNIVSTAVTTATVGQLYEYTVVADGTPPPTYTLPISPTGMTIDSGTGLIQWTPGATGTFGVEVQAVNSAGVATQSFSIDVSSQTPPLITSDPITTATVGQLYQYDVVADGTPPLAYSLPISPTGMTIDPGTGLIQWTPGATGTFGVEVEVINSVDVATQSFSIEVTETPVCTTNLISNWKLNETSGPPYQDSYGSHDATTCAGGNCPTPVTGRVGGAQLFESGNDTGLNVPVHPDFDWGQNESFSIEFWMKGVPGQTCAASSEVIVGRTEGVAGGLDWWLGCRPGTGQAAFELGVGAQYDLLEGPGDITDGNWHHVVGLREGASDINRLYVDGVEVVSSTTSYTTSLASASADLTVGWFDFDHGFNFEGSLDEVAIYNRALLATEVQQHYNFGPAGQDYCGVEAPNITSPAVTIATVGQLYQYDVVADGTPPLAYTLPISPTGMTIDPGSGVIQWTPGTTGTFGVEVEAINSAGAATQSFTITVSSLTPPLITSDPITTATVGQLYQYNVVADGTPPLTYSLPISPTGMTIDPGSGMIQWTPGATGTFAVEVEVINSVDVATQSFTIEVAPASSPPSDNKVYLPIILRN